VKELERRLAEERLAREKKEEEHQTDRKTVKNK